MTATEQRDVRWQIVSSLSADDGRRVDEFIRGYVFGKIMSIRQDRKMRFEILVEDVAELIDGRPVMNELPWCSWQLECP